VNYRKKLIEVALPLEAINKASAREKSIRHGHPSTLHLWWARRPMAAARAVIWAQLVDDPSANPDLFPTDKAQEKERKRLFGIIEDLVEWENTNNEEVLGRARAEIWQSWRRACADNADHPRARELFDRHRQPPFHDPFAGGGSLPVEAQRLGLETYASDLNPVAVLINKAMIEVPPRFGGKPPVNPEVRQDRKLITEEWKAARGLAEDIRYYGKWMRQEAEKRIGHLYPRVVVSAEMAKARPDLKPLVGRKLTVIAWLWARTVKSPNPAYARVDVPLVSTFMLSTKAGKEAYVEPVLEQAGYYFRVRMGKPSDPDATTSGTKLARGANFKCLMSEAPMAGDYIKSEGRAGRMGARLMAIVAESDYGRIYLDPSEDQETTAHGAQPAWKPETPLAPDTRALWTPPYGLTTFGDLFTTRQLVALTTLSGLVSEVREQVRLDALDAGLPEDTRLLRDGGTGATAYADALAMYCGMAVSKVADYNSSLVVWSPGRDQAKSTFARQALPMAWDFAEVNPLAEAAGDISVSLAGIARVIDNCPACASGNVVQEDAASQVVSADKVVSTDPPYYDNIGYADLSDYFYVWLRVTLREVFPELFATLAVPKAEELVATPYRHGSAGRAEAFFLAGMTQAMHRLAEQAHPAFPVTIYYAFKQSETEDEAGTSSTGWETFLEAVIEAGFTLAGTWPIRTERGARSIGIGTNALASSIILVCRRRPEVANTATRRDFLVALKAELPLAVAHLQKGNIAPVDLAQAAIGPGMAVYTRFSRVLDAAGKPLSVRDALALINLSLDEILAEHEGDFDVDTRWAVSWFEQCGFAEAEYGVAETLSKAKNTSVSGMKEAGILVSKGGRVRLLRPAELPKDWDPRSDQRLTTWEMVHHLVRSLDVSESAAAGLLAKLGTKAESARELAYRLYSVCERKKRAPEALAYNGLVQAWPELLRLSKAEVGPKKRTGMLPGVE
jgi:putative DNA methylase